MSGRESWTTRERRIKQLRREAQRYGTAFVRFVSNSFVAWTRAITKSVPELADFSPLVLKSVILLFAGPRCAVIFSNVVGK